MEGVPLNSVFICLTLMCLLTLDFSPMLQIRCSLCLLSKITVCLFTKPKSMPWPVTAFCMYGRSCLSYPWLCFIRIHCAPGINIWLFSIPFIFQVEDLQRQLESATKEQEALIDIFSEERNRRDQEEESLRKKLKVSEQTVTTVFCVARHSTTWLFSLLFLQTFRSTSSLAGRICHHTGLAGATERRQERPQSLRE